MMDDDDDDDARERKKIDMYVYETRRATAAVMMANQSINQSYQATRQDKD